MNSEKQYKHTEDRIIEAAGAADYAFNEASWKKMEALLDKKKNKRRAFFWIFSTLLLGTLFLGGSYVYQLAHKNDQLKIAEKQIDSKNKVGQQIQPSNVTDNIAPINQPDLPEKNTGNSNNIAAGTDANKNIDLSEKNTGNSNTVDVNTGNNKNINLLNSTNKNSAKAGTGKIKITSQAAADNYRQTTTFDLKTNRLKKLKTKRNTTNDDYSAVNKPIYKDGNKFAVSITTPELANDQDKNANKTDADSDTYLPVTKTANADSTNSGITKNKTILKPDTVSKKTNPTTKATDKKEKKKKAVAGFYVFGSAGAEASSTKLLSYKNSSIAPRYGLGLGYQLNRHFSVQAGFYAGAKKYIAGPDDYNVKAGSYLSTVKIIKVDANCMVYEIPVTLQYNWLIKPTTNYYVALGLNSYIMKKEKYNYTFERSYTQYTYPYEYTNNSHLFSSLQFSLGVEKQIGRKLYLQAAPALNIPLQGVGDGSVKIFTPSLQVGIKYFPFKH